jgi:small subunit ribosomal protein S17
MTETENNETEETPAEAQAPAEEAAAAPAEVVAPKERRRRARAAKAAQTRARQPLTPEERHAERLAQRQGKAQARRVERTRAREKARAARSESGTQAEATAPREHGPGIQKTRQGVVVSDKADKTITVRIDVARRHRRYEKIVRTSNTLHAHDEANDAHIGDTVIVRECRPMSRLKRWRLVEVVERAE